MTSFGEKLLLVDETTEASLVSSVLVLMVSFGSGGSGIGLIVNLTPSELVKTGPEFVLVPLEPGVGISSGIALMCIFGIEGELNDVSSSLTSRLLWCE